MDQGMFERLGRPVELRVQILAATMIRLRVLAGELGITEQEAFEEALVSWTLKREQTLRRRGRIALAEAMAKDFVGESGNVRPEGNMASDEAVRLPPMGTTLPSDDLKSRREQAGLTRIELAKLVQLSPAHITQLEGGYRPKRGDAVARVETLLATLEKARK